MILDGKFLIHGRVVSTGYATAVGLTEDDVPGLGGGGNEIAFCISGPSEAAIKAVLIKLGVPAEKYSERLTYSDIALVRNADLQPIPERIEDPDPKPSRLKGRLERLHVRPPEPDRTGQTGWLDLRLPE